VPPLIDEVLLVQAAGAQQRLALEFEAAGAR
jgi:hypothetical protein